MDEAWAAAGDMEARERHAAAAHCPGCDCPDAEPTSKPTGRLVLDDTRPVPGSPQPARDEQEQIELEALRRCPVPGSLETPGSPQPAEGGDDDA